MALAALIDNFTHVACFADSGLRALADLKGRIVSVGAPGLAPFAAAALTGGNPFRTMMLTWKYTLPAFLVPFTFCLSPDGQGLLLQGPIAGVVVASLTSAIGIVGLAIGIGGYVRSAASPLERGLATSGGLLLVYANTAADIAGLVPLALCVALHLRRTQDA